MVSPYKLSMDVRSSAGIQAGVQASSIQEAPSSPCPTYPTTRRGPGSGDSEPPEQESNIALHQMGRILQFGFRSTEEGWGVAPSHQSEGAQPVTSHPTLQDGGNQFSEGCTQGRGLVRQNRPEGFLPHCAHPSRSLEVSTIPLEGAGIPMHSPPLRISNSPQGVHEDHAPCDDKAAGARDQNRPILRRHSDHGGPTTHPEGTHDRGIRVPGLTRIHPQSQGVHHGAFPMSGVPGLHNRLPVHDHLTPHFREGEDREGVQEDPQGGESVSTGVGLPNRYADGSNTCNPSRSSPLQSPATKQTQSSEGSGMIRNNIESGSRSTVGPGLVDSQGSPAQWQANQDPQSRPDHRIRRIKEGLGSLLPEPTDRGTLGRNRNDTAYQYPGTESSFPGCKDVCISRDPQPHPVADRQPHSNCLHQSNGGHTLQDLVQPGLRDVAMVFGEEPNGTYRAHSRVKQCESGPRIPGIPGLQRLEIISCDIQEDHPQMGSSIGRPLCSETLSPAATLLQLPPGSRGNGSRCLRADLVGAQPICFSTICDGGEMSAEDETRQGGSCRGGRTSMERASLVPTTARHAGGQSSPASDVQLDSNEPMGGPSPPGLAGKAPLSRVASFRDSLQVQGVSEQACSSYVPLGEKGQRKPTPQPGGGGQAGVMRGVRIPYQPL